MSCSVHMSVILRSIRKLVMLHPLIRPPYYVPFIRRSCHDPFITPPLLLNAYIHLEIVLQATKGNPCLRFIPQKLHRSSNDVTYRLYIKFWRLRPGHYLQVFGFLNTLCSTITGVRCLMPVVLCIQTNARIVQMNWLNRQGVIWPYIDSCKYDALRFGLVLSDIQVGMKPYAI